MSLLQSLNNPNVQKFLIPFALGMIAIVSGWAVNQLPPLKNANQGWRVLKLTVEAAIAVVMFASFADAMRVMSGKDETAQLAGIAYTIVLLFLLIAIATNVWQLIRKPSSGETNSDVARKRDRRSALMSSVHRK